MSSSSYPYADANPLPHVDERGLKAVATDRYAKSPWATTVCDGYDRVVPFAGSSHFRDAKERKCTGECVLMHEQSHANDMEISDSNVCKNKRNGVIVAWETKAEAYQSERRAYHITLHCLDHT